jgi:hypothetical protein
LLLFVAVVVVAEAWLAGFCSCIHMLVVEQEKNMNRIR